MLEFFFLKCYNDIGDKMIYIIIGLVVVLLILLVIYFYYEDFKLQVTKYSLKFD